MKQFFKKDFCNYIYFNFLFIIIATFYVYTKSELLILIYFINFYWMLLPVVVLHDYENYRLEVLKICYFTLFLILIYIVYANLFLKINVHYGFILSAFAALIYLYVIYLSGDVDSIQEVIRILTTIIILIILHLYTNRLNIPVIFISSFSLFFYAVGGRYIMICTFYKLLKDKTDAASLTINYFFSKLFYYTFIAIWFFNKMKRKFFTNMLYNISLRIVIWCVAYIFGSYKLFILVNGVLLLVLFLNSIVEFFLINKNFSNVLVNCLRNKESEKLITAACEIKDSNIHIDNFYNFFSINYYISCNMDRDLANRFKGLMEENAVHNSLENIYFNKYLEAAILKGDNRNFNNEWLYALALSKKRFDETGSAEDNYVAGFLLQSYEEKEIRLGQYSDKSYFSFSLLRNNRDSLIIKSPAWYINICSGLFL